MRYSLAIILLLLISHPVMSQTQLRETYTTLVDKTGNISLPTNYQNQWAFIGSYFVRNTADNTNNPKTFTYDIHSVYTQPSAATYYRKHKQFPDGAVLIKRVSTTQTEPLTTGLASYEGELKVTFMMVKDKKNRFSSNKAWAEGWGWALFNPKSTTSQTTNWKGKGLNNCFACHLPVKSNDWIYTQGYQTVLK